MFVYVPCIGNRQAICVPERQVYGDQFVTATVKVRGDKLYFLTQKGARRFRLLATSLAQPGIAHAQVIVPEGRAVISSFALAREGLYVLEREGATSRLLRVAENGLHSRPVPLPFDGYIDTPVTDPRQSGALFDMQGWVRPPRVFSYDLGGYRAGTGNPTTRPSGRRNSATP